MISLEDCIGMCGLTAAEVAAIAEHEHLPDIVAAELGTYLLHLPRGGEAIARMLTDDIRDALANGDARHASLLMAALRHFLSTHPVAGSFASDQGGSTR